MESILISLLSSFYLGCGLPALIYDATYNLIREMYNPDAASYFSMYVKTVDNMYYFRNGTPEVDVFIRLFEKFS